MLEWTEAPFPSQDVAAAERHLHWTLGGEDRRVLAPSLYRPIDLPRKKWHTCCAGNVLALLGEDNWSQLPKQQWIEVRAGDATSCPVARGARADVSYERHHVRLTRKHEIARADLWCIPRLLKRIQLGAEDDRIGRKGLHARRGDEVRLETARAGNRVDHLPKCLAPTLRPLEFCPEKLRRFRRHHG